jgi:predicted porin
VDNDTTGNDYTISGVGARVPLGAGAVIAQYGQIDPQTGADRDTLSVGYLHNLSKRTELYAVAMHDKIEGLSSGGGYSFGIRHRF